MEGKKQQGQQAGRELLKVGKVREKVKRHEGKEKREMCDIQKRKIEKLNKKKKEDRR